MCQWPDDKRLGKLLPMVNLQQLDSLDAEELRALASELLAQMARHDASIASKDQEIERKDGELQIPPGQD